jgi:hypothetical protein
MLWSMDYFHYALTFAEVGCTVNSVYPLLSSCLTGWDVHVNLLCGLVVSKAIAYIQRYGALTHTELASHQIQSRVPHDYTTTNVVKLSKSFD